MAILSSFVSRWQTARMLQSVGRLPRYRPLLRAEFVRGDLFGEAAFLLHAGYRMAAVMTMRVAVERMLKRVALQSPEWRSVRRPGVERLAYFLQSIEVIDETQKRDLESFAGQCGAVAHGANCDLRKATRLVDRGESLRSMLHEILACLVADQVPAEKAA